LNGTLEEAFKSSVLTTFPQIRRVFLGTNNFASSIPNLICDYPLLEAIGLNNLNLNSSLPICLGNITGLREFNAAGSNLSRPFPHINQLANLRVLNLANNSLSGPLPVDIGSALAQLTSMDLSSNNDLVGVFPSGFAGFKFGEDNPFGCQNVTGFECPRFL
jgi:hypothetical protein